MPDIDDELAYVGLWISIVGDPGVTGRFEG